MKTHLEPLAIAANIMQSAFCRLDEVLFTFGSLYLHYSHLTDPIDLDVKNAVLKSINQRWAKCDQDVFVAAAILNPFISTSAFKTAPFLSLAGILSLMARLHLRFFRKAAPLNILNANINDYFNNKGTFSSFPSLKDAIRLQAAAEVSLN